MQCTNGLAVLVFIGAFSAVAYGSDVASKIRDYLGMNCTSFDDCIAQIQKDDYGAVREWMKGSYNVMQTKVKDKDEWTFSVNGTLSPGPFPVNKSQVGLQLIGRIESVLPSLYQAITDGGEQVVVEIGVGKPKTVVRHLKVDLTKLYVIPDNADGIDDRVGYTDTFLHRSCTDPLPSTDTTSQPGRLTELRFTQCQMYRHGNQTYDARVSASSLNTSADLLISVDKTLVSEPVDIKIDDLVLGLRVTLAQQRGHLQVTNCTAIFSYAGIIITTEKHSKLNTLVLLGNIFLTRPTTADQVTKEICDRVLVDLNKVLQRGDHHQAMDPNQHHHNHHHQNHHDPLDQ